MPKPPLLGEVASSEAKMSERLYRAAPALFRSLERRPLSNLSVSHPLDSSPSRRALGKEVLFRSNTRCCDKTSPPQSLPLSGEVARRSRDGEGKDADKKQKNTAIQALFVRDIVSLCFRVLFCRACPLRRWRASSPKGRALGKEVSFSMKPTGAYWKTSRDAKASPTRGGGIERSEDDGEVVQSSTCVIPLTLKASFVQPLSLASARQLSWQESPWQRGFVFDETDLRLLENVTECQSLPY